MNILSLRSVTTNTCKLSAQIHVNAAIRLDGNHQIALCVENDKKKCNKRWKGKVAPVHAVKAYRGSRGTAPHILNLDTR